MTTASPLLHPPLVAPYQSAHTRVPVLRQGPARALGVTSSAWAHGVPAEGALFCALRLRRLERLALQGWPLLSGSLSFRVRSCLQALTGRACVVVRASLQALHRQRLRRGRSHSTTGPMAWASSNAGQIIQENGA